MAFTLFHPDPQGPQGQGVDLCSLVLDCAVFSGAQSSHSMATEICYEVGGPQMGQRAPIGGYLGSHVFSVWDDSEVWK